MGFRNRLTTASDVNTVAAGGGGVRIYNTPGTYGIGVVGVVEFQDGFGDPPAQIVGRPVPNQRATNATDGGSLTLSGGTYNGTAAPSLALSTSALGAGSYSRDVLITGADNLKLNGARLGLPGYLADAASAGDPTSTAAGTVIGTLNVTVPSDLPAGTRIKVTGTAFVSTPTGVGATIALGGRARTINQGSAAGDVTVVYYDADLTAGARTYTLTAAPTVAGQTITCRRPTMQAEIV